jgi:hypothetical protein
MTCIVDDDVEPAVIGDHLVDAGLDGRVRADIQLDGPEIDAVLFCIGFDLGDTRRVTARSFAHRGIGGVPCPGKELGREQAEAARRARDENDFLHGFSPGKFFGA